MHYSTILWYLSKKSIPIPTVTGTFTYDGTEKSAEISEYDETYITQSGVSSATDAGTYTIGFTLKDTANTQWTDGSTDIQRKTWTIDKAQIIVYDIGTKYYDYTGSEIEDVVTMFEYDENIMNRTGTWKATDVGTYSHVYTIKSSNYTFARSSGTIVTKCTFTFVIQPKSITIPTVSGSYDYDGTQKSAVITDFDSTYVNQSGTSSATEAGEYTVTFSLKSTTNTQWSDGASGQKSGTWIICNAS